MLSAEAEGRWGRFDFGGQDAPQVDLRALRNEGQCLTREVTIRRQAVLDLVKTLTVPQSSKQMARQLKVKEVSVRAAITWLVLGGFIEKDGYVIQRYFGKSYKKKIDLYVWTGKKDPLAPVRVKDVDALAREQMNKQYGDGGAELADIMMVMSRKVG